MAIEATTSGARLFRGIMYESVDAAERPERDDGAERSLVGGAAMATGGGGGGASTTGFGGGSSSFGTTLAASTMTEGSSGSVGRAGRGLTSAVRIVSEAPLENAAAGICSVGGAASVAGASSCAIGAPGAAMTGGGAS
jgi:hypothetical protein